MLVGERLFQQYDGVPIVRDVSIAIDAGGVTVLMGKSGSGKSTLIRTLAVVDPPRSGSITFAGKRIYPAIRDTAGSAPIWPDITVVSQQFQMWPHETLRRNIILPAQLRKRPMHDAEGLCQALGLGDLLDRYPNQVSVGQRQRAALARALLLQPKILLLDEVTSAQDVQHIALILDVLGVAVKSGVGLLVVSHHLGFARQILSMSKAARVVFLDSGCVIESGGVDCLEGPVSDELRTYVQLSRALA